VTSRLTITEVRQQSSAERDCSSKYVAKDEGFGAEVIIAEGFFCKNSKPFYIFSDLFFSMI
jgi:hypothetical protein